MPLMGCLSRESFPKACRRIIGHSQPQKASDVAESELAPARAQAKTALYRPEIKDPYLKFTVDTVKALGLSPPKTCCILSANLTGKTSIVS